MPSPHDDLKLEVIDCINSLQKAMQDAGGALLSTETMKNMSLMEFILCNGHNGIRFHYKKPTRGSSRSKDREKMDQYWDDRAAEGQGLANPEEVKTESSVSGLSFGPNASIFKIGNPQQSFVNSWSQNGPIQKKW